MLIPFDNFLKTLPRFASIAPLKRLTFDHLLRPAISVRSYKLRVKTCLIKSWIFATAHLAREWLARKKTRPIIATEAVCQISDAAP
jgi:hypothetical protein